MRILTILFLIFFLSGCSLPAFWARGEEGPTKHERLVRLGLLDSENTPTEEEYQYHFNFWKSWMADFVDHLNQGGHIDDRSINRKRILKQAVESEKHLRKIHALLLHEKQTELDPHIDRMGEVIALVESIPNGTDFRRLARDMAREKRIVDKKFRYNQVKVYIDQAKAYQSSAYDE